MVRHGWATSRVAFDSKETLKPSRPGIFRIPSEWRAMLSVVRRTALGWAGAVLAAVALHGEERVPFGALPAAVKRAAEQHKGHGVIQNVVKESEGDEVTYEVEILEDGKEKDIVLDLDGKVVEIATEMEVESLPAPVRDALAKLAGRGRVLELESKAREGSLTYEAMVLTTGGKLTRFRLGPDGERLPPGSF
jgi:hypothetical protein